MLSTETLKEFVIQGGSVRGMKHRNSNNQDGYTFGTVVSNKGETVRWGVVVDGCSSGLRSDAGVQDALHFFETHMPKYVLAGNFRTIPDQLIMHDLIEYIEVVTVMSVLGKSGAKEFLEGKFSFGEHPQRNLFDKYIRDFYLFTVFGFIQTPKTIYVFYRGDGAVQVNEVCSYHLSENEAPLYPAYFAIPWSVPQIAVSNRHMHLVEYDTKDVFRIILGTDSWLRHKPLFQKLSEFLSLRNLRSLQRRLIIWSEDASDPKLPNEEIYRDSVAEAFSDDTTALALLALEEK